MRLLYLTTGTTPKGKIYAVHLEDRSNHPFVVKVTPPQLLRYEMFAAAVAEQTGLEFNFFIGPWASIPTSKRETAWMSVARRLVSGNWFWAAAALRAVRRAA